ncbi:MAG: proteasome accessory factor PafA2 family protein [Cytophagales bacterium]|nr:proteasome accessory factor PafA2 family protein [Armatimonadota bacterium]
MIGIETEYGIYVEGKGAQDLVVEATHLVKLCPPPVATGWDYSREHPRRDVRGFTVDHLSVDPHDAQFEQTGRPHSTDVEVRSDRVLPSGARLYNDHGHPEFSTPECTTLRELIASDRAGERVMQACAERRMSRMGGGLVAMYKNNTDFHGASYGTHESYLIQRSLPFELLLEGILPFFTTRQIFAGAGKVGMEQAGGTTSTTEVPFQLSQRADFFTTIASVDTLHNRPIVNTRDEPHADARLYRRFHVICGDANLCEMSTLLKVGTTLLVLRLLETGWRVPQTAQLRDPVAAIKQISRDQSFRWHVERSGGGTIGAVEIQRLYLAAAKEKLTGLSGETDVVLAEWEQVLNRLDTDPLSLSDTLDWAAKRTLLEEFRGAEGMDWRDPTLISLDLEYHNVDPAAGLYYGLEQEGRVRRVVTEGEIAAAVAHPPANSPRALVRGLAVSKFAEAVKSVTWSRLDLDDGSGQTVGIRMSQVQDLDPTKVQAALGKTTTPGEFVAALEALERESGTASGDGLDAEDD